MVQDHWGDDIAETYDVDAAEMYASDVLDPAVDFLADLAGSGRVLEFAVGTGRVALPLSARGVEVHGLDLSEPMLARLRAKPGADAVPVVVGDYTSTRVEGSFSLVYLVWNTIMNVTAQDEQVETFLNAARHLEPGGAFVVEVMIPDLQRLPPGDTVRAFTLTDSHLGFDEYDVANQILRSHHYWIERGRASSAPYRYVWPAELDLMARIAGMTLTERYAGWDREPFTSESRTHVSVWRKL
jgi:SAM-dependent methyltransferase